MDMKRPWLQSDNRLLFFKGFLERPQQVASIIPSSRFLERRIVQLSGATRARVMVEFGPGTGGTTRALLRAMPKDGRLLCIELNPHFLPVLRGLKDPRLIVHEGDALDVAHAISEHRLSAPDVVLSGIPFSTIKREQGQQVVQSVFRALMPGGCFVAYQVRDRVEGLGRAFFGPAKVAFELRNVPPIRIYRWVKKQDGT